MTDEMKELLKQIQELREELKDSELKNKTQELNYSYKEMEDQLDRNLELLKRFEVESKVERLANDLNKLAEEQQNLSESIPKNKEERGDISEQTKKNAEEFQKIMDEYQENLKKNKELKSPLNLSDFEKQEQDVNESFEKLDESIPSENKKSVKEQMQNNSQQMQKIAEQMQEDIQDNSMSMSQENAEDLKQILENTLSFSFSQEDIYTKLSKTYTNNPQYQNVIKDQNQLISDFSIIRDSLNALAARTPQISSMVLQELQNIDKYSKHMETSFQSNSRRAILTDQRNILVSVNKLSLLLDEIMQQMQDQMKNSSSSSSSKSKKGKGSPGFKSFKEQQENLKKQMEQMLEQMKSGKSMGKGQKKQLAEFLAEQEMFQQKLQDLMNSGQLSPQTQKLLKDIQHKNEQNQMDIINSRINKQTLKRQQDIVTRLLEAEKSENKREFDEKRKSNEATDFPISNPQDYFEDVKEEKGINEQLQYKQIKMKSYFNTIYKKYINTISR